MLATLVTAVVSGLRGELVRVEVDVAPGIPSCQIVGLPDTALSEARERVRAAVRNSGFDYPASRITVNLAPADRRKFGAAYDLAIAVGILVASGQVKASGGRWALLGELSLGGEVTAVPGVLPMVATLARAGHLRIGVPADNVGEALLVDGVEAVGLERLEDAARLVAGPRGRRAAGAGPRPRVSVSGASAPEPVALAGAVEPVDLSEIRGQPAARWALEVAVAGGHNMLLVGPPGAGKTLLGRAIPGLLPPLDDAEALEVTVVESVAGVLSAAPGLRRTRPFRAPHHTSSYAALVGGGPRLGPGEVTRAHLGVLFLDELAEFDRSVLDSLRQPLEEGTIVVARAHGEMRYPARVQLVAAMNPCRCGFFGDPERECRCPPRHPDRYVQRVSGPLLDRFDIRLELARVPPDLLLAGPEPEATAVVAARIAQARARALARSGGLVNARLSGAGAVRAAGLDTRSRRRLTEIATAATLSARGVHRILRVARSVADLEDSERVLEVHLLAAASLRDPATGRLVPTLAA